MVVPVALMAGAKPVRGLDSSASVTPLRTSPQELLVGTDYKGAKPDPAERL